MQRKYRLAGSVGFSGPGLACRLTIRPRGRGGGGIVVVRGTVVVARLAHQQQRSTRQAGCRASVVASSACVATVATNDESLRLVRVCGLRIRTASPPSAHLDQHPPVNDNIGPRQHPPLTAGPPSQHQLLSSRGNTLRGRLRDEQRGFGEFLDLESKVTDAGNTLQLGPPSNPAPASRAPNPNLCFPETELGFGALNASMQRVSPL